MNRACIFSPIAIVLTLTGCVTVDPRPDYETTITHILETTGYDQVYRPGDDEIVLAQVEAMLAGGITVDEAAQICLLNNPQLQAAFYEIGIARADVVQAGLLSNPGLSVSLRLPSGGGLANLEAGLVQNIAELWQIPPRKRAAERQLDHTILTTAAHVSDLVRQAKRAYFRTVSSREALNIEIENQTIAGQLSNAADERLRAGAGSQLEGNLARSELVEAEIVVQASRQDAYESKIALARMLGLTLAPEEFEVIDPLPDPPSWQLDTMRLEELAREHRLDLKAARDVAEAALAEWEQQKRSVIRRLDVGVALERGQRTSGSDRDLAAESVFNSISSGMPTAPQLKRRKDKHTNFIIGPTLDLELPLFDQNQAQIAKAKYKYEQALKTLEGLFRGLTQEVRATSRRAQASWEMVRAYRERLLPQRRDNLELSREAYRLGMTSFLAVLEAQRGYLAARRKYVESLFDAALSLLALEQATHQPLSKILEAPQQPPAESSDAPDVNKPNDLGVEP